MSEYISLAILMSNSIDGYNREVERSKLDSKDQEGKTGLVRAIIGVNMKVADILLEAGADPNVKIGVNEDSPLHIAVRLNSEWCVTKLLDHGADFL